MAGCNFSITLEHASNDFRLHSDVLTDTTKLEIIDCRLGIDRKRLRDVIQRPLYAHWAQEGSIEYEYRFFSCTILNLYYLDISHCLDHL